MQTIGVFNLKGGVAKTTSCWALGNVLSQYMGKKVLLVDADQSTDLTGFFLQSIGKTDGLFYPNLRDCLEGSVPVKDAIRKFMFCRAKGTSVYDDNGKLIEKTKNTFYTDMESPVPGESIISDDLSPTRCCVLDLLPGSPDTEQLLSYGGAAYDDPWRLRRILEELNYDIVLIDFPPSRLNTTKVAAFACDYLIVPAEADRNSLNGLANLFKFIKPFNDEGSNIEILGVFFTRTRLSETAQSEAVRSTLEIFDGMDTIFPYYIRQSSLCGKCNDEGLLPSILEPTNNFTKDYLDVAKALAQRLRGDYSGRIN